MCHTVYGGASTLHTGLLSRAQLTLTELGIPSLTTYCMPAIHIIKTSVLKLACAHCSNITVVFLGFFFLFLTQQLVSQSSRFKAAQRLHSFQNPPDSFSNVQSQLNGSTWALKTHTNFNIFRLSSPMCDRSVKVVYFCLLTLFFFHSCQGGKASEAAFISFDT